MIGYLSMTQGGHGYFAEQGMTSLSANDATVVFCSSKTEGSMIGYLAMTQGGHGYFAETGKTSLSAKDATAVLCSSKTEGSMIGFLSMTQEGHGYFCVGMTSLPADYARVACFLLHRTAVSVLPMGVNPRALS